jgi:uncharacterized protein (DUF924 family)
MVERMTTPEEVIAFWLGELRADGTADPEIAARWWVKDPAFDALLEARFGQTLRDAERGAHDAWASTPQGRVALVIVLDQLSRNLRRGSPDAFANDAKALALADAGVAANEHRALPPMHAYFLLMPFMHAEDVEVQGRGVALFRELADRASSDALRATLESAWDYAERHRVIVERFGRFPHRNAVLGRESTAEELAFLKEPGSSF